MEPLGYEIHVYLERRGRARYAAWLRRAIRQALKTHKRRSAMIDVNLVSDRAIARLNREFLQHAGPTDVISLNYGHDNSQLVEGEMYISIDTARREARRRGHRMVAELCLYAIHGTLHLLGYDDRDPADAQRMHAKEDELLKELGLGAVYG
jgi:probable rRNA maturation factor